jgi:hypothetical protein
MKETLRISTVNRALQAEGIDAELVRGDGYFYFVGPDVELASTTSVMVYRLNQLSLSGWLYEAREFKRQTAEVKQRLGEEGA